MLAGFALIAIPMALFLILNIGSIIYAFWISFWNWTIAAGARDIVGGANYERILSDGIFHRAIYNTLTYTAIVVPLQMALGLLLAVIVNAKIRGQTFFRASFYFPAIASSAAITVLFIFIMQPQGLFNGVREVIGLNPLFEALGFNERFNWLGNERTALGSIMALNIWTTSGTMMLFYLASLQTISREVYEAAALDGANAWQTFWRITFPLLKPGHYFVATVSVIGALQVFDQGYIAGGSQGNPNYSLMTIVLYLYNAVFQQAQLGYAAAVGIVLFVIIFSATLIQRRLFGSAPAW
jgi:ABC-type sugar transport system permease subunit